MALQQLVSPNPNAQDATGMCLRFTQRVFQDKNTIFYNSAWDAWNGAKYKHRDRNFQDDTAVPLWFAHWGTYGNPPTYANWGHVVTRFPGGGLLSSPASGYGQQWFPSIESVERAFNAQYVGWTEDIGGLRVVRPSSAPNPAPIEPVKKRKKTMFIATCKHTESDRKQRWYVYGPGFWLVLESKSSAEAHAKQLDVKMSAIPEYGAAAIKKFQNTAKAK